MEAADQPERDDQLLAGLSVAACLLDSSLTVAHPNSGACDLLRLPEPFRPPVQIVDHVHPFDRAAVLSDLQAAFLGPGSAVISCRAGHQESWSFIDIHLGPERGPVGRIAVFTPRRFNPDRQKSVAEATPPLEDQAEEWRRFAYTVAHDLKVPLVTMESNLLLMQNDIQSGETDRLGDDIREVSAAVLKMKRLVVELLDLARIGRLDLIAAAHSRAMDDVNLNELVDQIAREVRTAHPAWSGTLGRVGSLPTIRGRKTQLTEVFQNLIDNAVKYTHEARSPRVEVGCEQRFDGQVLFVRDNGPGIPIADRKRVFDLFVQLRPGASGVGIGLSIVRSIMASQKGSLWIEDGIDGGGVSFCFATHSSGSPT